MSGDEFGGMFGNLSSDLDSSESEPDDQAQELDYVTESGLSAFVLAAPFAAA